MGQKSLDEVLKAVIEKWKAADATWVASLKIPADFERAYFKGQTLNPWGERVRQAIQGLEADRCNELTVDEIAAYLKQSQKNAEVKLRAYLDVETEGQGPSEGGYHLGNAHRGRYERWHYHRDPFQAFLDQQKEQLHEKKVAIGRAAWKSEKGVALRQGKQRNEDRRQADIFADAAQLAAERLAGQPDLAAALKILAKDPGVLKAHGITIELQLIPAFAAFVDAQTVSIERGVTEPQPWLTDSKGRVVDHAGWPLTGTSAIRTLMAKGGTVESMPLVMALKRDWKPGNALMFWHGVAQLATWRWREDLLKHLPANRARDSMENTDGMRKRDRKRS